MKTIICIVGTSLLTNRVGSYIRNAEPFPQQFIDSLDQDRWAKFAPWERADFGKIASIVRDDAEEKLAAFLQPSRGADLVRESAETNSLKLLLDRLPAAEGTSPAALWNQVKLQFVATNTVMGRACARALGLFYRDIVGIRVEELVIIEQLRGEASAFQQGLSELIDRLVEIITREKEYGNEVFLNATAGFKPESAYATICGLLNQVDVFYAHEHFRSELVRLPAIPLGIDFSLWHLSASKIQLALLGNKPAYDALPQEVKELMFWDEAKKLAGFNELGRIFWATYQDTCARHHVFHYKGLLTEGISDPALRAKILKFIEGWDHIWVGMQVPQMLDHSQAHCQNLLVLAEQLLLPMEGLLSEEELYLLIACIWLHDIGHCEPLEIRDDGSVVPLTPNEIRKRHHLLSYQLIRDWPTEFGFPSFNQEAELIATLCKFHKEFHLYGLPEKCSLTIYNDTETSELHRAEVRPRLIAALLRLVDACDMGLPRAGSQAYVRARTRATERELANFRKLKDLADEAGEKYFSRFLEEQVSFREPSGWHFEVHQRIGGVEIVPEKVNRGGWRVRLIVHPRKGNDNVMGYVLGDPINMQKDIDAIRGFLEPHITEVLIESGEAAVDQ